MSACSCVLSCSFVSDSLRPHGLKPSRLLFPWDSPSKNTGVGCHFFFSPGDIPDPGIEPTSPPLAGGSLPVSHQGCQRFQAVLAERESCIRAGCYHQEATGEGHSAQSGKGKLKDRSFFFFSFFSFAGN